MIDRTVNEAMTAGSAPVVQARNVHKSFGDAQVLKGIDLECAEGEVVALLGPSGSGKTTFLRCINHLETIDSGEILVNGRSVGYEIGGDRVELPEKEIAARRSDIGMVFQNFNLFPHLSALENVSFGLTNVKHIPKVQAREEARELLEKVGLGHRVDAHPRQMSGGQQQRVGIARALAMKPSLILFDEPTSALDPELVDEVLGVMTQLAKEGMTMLVVTHEVRFARDVASKVCFMDGGVVVEMGPPEQVIDNPIEQRTREFFSRTR